MTDTPNFYRPASRWQGLRAGLAALALLTLGACSDGSDSFDVERLLSGCADTNSCAANPALEIGGERPSTVYIPSDYDPATRYPLVVLLHGFGASGFVQSLYMDMDGSVDEKQWVLVTPDGTENAQGSRFWNATPSCCAFSEEDQMVDDVAYIRGLIEEAAATYSIDTSRVALIGHSNGGFMSLRLACEASDYVTTVLSLAGSTWAEAESCAPATYPVSVLALHGTDDETIPYEGSESRGFPGAPETAERFAVLAGCDPEVTTRLEDVDMDGAIAGAETERIRYENCVRGATVELWTMNGSPHIPFPWTELGYNLMHDWLIEHPR